MALFRNQPIWDGVRQLQLTLHNQSLSVPSAAVAGCQRLGEEPLAHLFRLFLSGVDSLRVRLSTRAGHAPFGR
ncbi:hypothetical protein [Limnohabitans sp. Jir72]|uniref:hypothetical protein n=1 Tax=Limnohabitans sp. Jir72 TaxID=1977909 RepID=UPI0035169AB7